MKLIKQDCSMHIRMIGTITAADIRKKFNIPDDAEITIDLPFVDYDNRGGRRTFDDGLQLDVRVERIK